MLIYYTRHSFNTFSTTEVIYVNLSYSTNIFPFCFLIKLFPRSIYQILFFFFTLFSMHWNVCEFLCLFQRTSDTKCVNATSDTNTTVNLIKMENSCVWSKHIITYKHILTLHLFCREHYVNPMTRKVKPRYVNVKTELLKQQIQDGHWKTQWY